jgi:hypothetical protein
MSSSKLKMTSKTTQNTAKWIAMSLLTTIKYKAVRSLTCTKYYTTADTISYDTKNVKSHVEGITHNTSGDRHWLYYVNVKGSPPLADFGYPPVSCFVPLVLLLPNTLK